MADLKASGLKSKQLRSLKKIVTTYLYLNEKIAKDWEYVDVPWWHNERANLSLFVGAIWNSGGIAFEEYSTPKKDSTGMYTGRNDLYFNFNQKDYIAEAKVLYLSGSGKQEAVLKRIISKLKEAKSDVKKNSKLNSDERLAVVFVAPYFNLRKISSLNDDIRKFTDIISQLDYSLIGWNFPQSTRNNIIWKNNIHFPGIAIIIKKV